MRPFRFRNWNKIRSEGLAHTDVKDTKQIGNHTSSVEMKYTEKPDDLDIDILTHALMIQGLWCLG
jgi:hypothetical protein